MGRLAKKGLEFFPVDVDMFQDIRIRKLIRRQGGKAVAIYALLLCLIYKNGYYMQWDRELPFICSETSGFDEAYISEVVKTCLTLGLFDKTIFENQNVLTSRGIQMRYSNIQRLNRRLVRIDEYRLVEESQPPAEPRSKKQAARRPPALRKKEARPAQQADAQPSAPAEAKVNKPLTNAEYKEYFFADARKASLTALCKNLGFKKPDFAELQRLADDVISEWELSELTHRDFTDWSRHLISTMRIKRAFKKNPTPPAVPKQPQQQDYSFDGGFGGQDT